MTEAHKHDTTLQWSALLSVWILVGLIYGCGQELESKQVLAPFPLAKVDFWGNRITVFPAENADLGELVDLGIFDEFRPGIDFARARQVAGEPDEIRKCRRGPCYIYACSRSTVVVAYEESRSGDTVFKAWRLYAYPHEDQLSRLVHSSIAPYLDNSLSGTVELVIMRPDHERPAVEVILRDQKVEFLTWFP